MKEVSEIGIFNTSFFNKLSFLKNQLSNWLICWLLDCLICYWFVVCTTLYKGIFLLFGTSSSSSIRSFSHTFQLPYVTLGLGGPPVYRSLDGRTQSSQAADESSRKNQFSLYIRPVTEGAVLDIIRYYGWKKIIFLYDSIQGNKREAW